MAAKVFTEKHLRFTDHSSKLLKCGDCTPGRVEVAMVRGIVNRERAEWMVSMFQDDIKSRREWCDRGWISEATRDLEIANITARMSIPQRLLDILNG
jgi:hypothetical protein